MSNAQKNKCCNELVLLQTTDHHWKVILSELKFLRDKIT